MRLLHAQSRAGRADAVSTLGDVLLNPVSFFQGVTAFDERRTHRLNDDFNLLVAYCPVPDLRRPGLRFRRSRPLAQSLVGMISLSARRAVAAPPRDLHRALRRRPTH